MVVTGVGWLSAWGYGLVKTGVQRPLGSGKQALPPRAEVFRYPFKNFGRLDKTSQRVCCAVGLALRDSGWIGPWEPETLVGIVGGGRRGCMDADILYFEDYLRSGRTLGRGNYFVYTLPTSPLAEASIHFGFRAATLYLQDSAGGMGRVMDTAADLIRDGEASIMLAGISEADSACFAVVEPANKSSQARALCPLEAARHAADAFLGTGVPVSRGQSEANQDPDFGSRNPEFERKSQ